MIWGWWDSGIYQLSADLRALLQTSLGSMFQMLQDRDLLGVQKKTRKITWQNWGKIRWNALFVDVFLHFLGPNLKATNQQHVSEWNAEHRCGIWCRFAVQFFRSNFMVFFLAGKPWTFCPNFPMDDPIGSQALLFKHWRCIVFNSWFWSWGFGGFALANPLVIMAWCKILKKNPGFSGKLMPCLITGG